MPLIITMLSRGNAYDFPFMAADFKALRQASDIYPGQREHVNPAMMVAIDEMTARFRVLEHLIHVGQIIATKTEVKKALFSFKFYLDGAEFYSTIQEAVTGITEINNSFDEAHTKISLNSTRTACTGEGLSDEAYKEISTSSCARVKDFHKGDV